MTTTTQRQLWALGNPSRRAILEKLARRPLAVGELAECFPISRPAVSQHLRILTEARLVLHHRQGTQNIYRVNPDGIAALRDYLDAMWTRSLRDFKAVAESSYNRARKEKS